MICVGPSESLAILVIQNDLPATVFSPLVFPEDRMFSSFHVWNTNTLDELEYRVLQIPRQLWFTGSLRCRSDFVLQLHSKVCEWLF
jgi:hypothetical protein